MKPGIYDNLDIEKYHQADGLSNSSLSLIEKNPLNFKNPGPRKSSTAFDVGSAAHKLILEKEDYWKAVAVAPSSVLNKAGGRSGKLYSEWAESFGAGKTILTQAESDSVTAMAESFDRPQHKTAKALLNHKGAIYEQSMFFYHPLFENLLCKVRPDIRIPDIKTVVDVKTCIDASPEGFSKAIANFAYHRQGAFYLDGVSCATGDEYQNFVFIAVEKTPPHSIGVYLACGEMIGAGRMRYEEALKTYLDCEAADFWPSYPDEVVEVALPYWAQKKDDELYN